MDKREARKEAQGSLSELIAAVEFETLHEMPLEIPTVNWGDFEEVRTMVLKTSKCLRTSWALIAEAHNSLTFSQFPSNQQAPTVTCGQILILYHSTATLWDHSQPFLPAT